MENGQSTSNKNIRIDQSSKTQLALGSMLGLSLLVLAAVIIGWIWTCWAMKKGKEVKSSQLNR